MEHFDTHICLVSAQPLPNLLPLLDKRFRPRKVILAVSPEMKQQARALQKIVQQQGIGVERYPVVDAHSLAQMQKDMSKLIAQCRGRNVALNVTGGTKPMAFGALAAMSQKLPIFYVRIDNDHVDFLDHPAGMGSFRLQPRLSLPIYLQVHGVASSPGVHKPDTRPPNWNDLCRQMIQHPEQYKSIRARMPEENRLFRDGGWLEEIVFDIVRNLPGIQDCAKSLDIRAGNSHNEIDIAFIAHNSLHLIECKTGRKRGVEVICKFHTVRELIGLRTQGLIVSYHDLRPVDRQRAQDLRIGICEIASGLNFAGLQNQIRRFAGV